MAHGRFSRRDWLRTVPLTALGIAGGVRSGSTVVSGQPSESIAQDTSGPYDQRAKLVADDGDIKDAFGWSVAVSGDGTTALVAASDEESPNGQDSGAVYAFAQSSGFWQQDQKFTPSDGDADDFFGWSIAVSDDGSTALVGAGEDENPNGGAAGSAYVFERSGGSWQQQQKLAASDGDADDYFGKSVALSGDGTTAVVGAWNDEDPNGDLAGSAYVFERSNGSWQQQKLTAQDGDTGDAFGWSVAVSGDGSTVLVAASDEEDPNGQDAGAVDVFERSGSSWQQEQKLTASDGDAGDFFGWSVTISNDGTTALIGAGEDNNSNGDTAGSVYVFDRAGGSWQQQQRMVADNGDAGDSFGKSVALSGDGSTAIIGTDNSETPYVDGAGSAYMFTQSSGTWQQQQELTISDPDFGDTFGNPVAVSETGTTALVGNWRDDPSDARSGSAYVFSSAEGPDGPPPLPGQDDNPQDIDGDGVYEDLDGDGELTLSDVRLYYQELYQKRDGEYVQEYGEFFDLDGNGEITLADLQALFEERGSQST